MNPKSNTLFHFTKSRETLKKILKGGFWPRYCLEDVGWLGYQDVEYVAYPVVCFCEIPLSRISDHVGFYGSFGIGLTRRWAELNGLNPVLYVAGDNGVTESFRELNDIAKQQQEKVKMQIWAALRHSLSYAKPTSGVMLMEGRPAPKQFYQESEWRYVAKNENVRDHLIKSRFDDEDQLRSENELTRIHCALRFGPSDIRYIFVKEDADIPDVVNFIQTDLDAFTGLEQKVLVSRIVSLESLSMDL